MDGLSLLFCFAGSLETGTSRLKNQAFEWKFEFFAALSAEAALEF